MDRLKSYSYCTVLSLAIVRVPPSTTIVVTSSGFVSGSIISHSRTPTLKEMVVSPVKGEGTSKNMSTSSQTALMVKRRKRERCGAYSRTVGRRSGVPSV